jgi:hypothetical protein
MAQDEGVQSRVEELTREAEITLEAIRNLASGGVADPLADAATLSQAVQTGILDAPQLKNNPYGRGQIVTRIDNRSACIAINPATGNPFNEHNRIATLMDPSSHTSFTKEI